MKKLFLLISLFFVNSIVSQNEIKYQDLNTEDLEHVYNRFDRVVKVEIFHDNGELYQRGYLKNNKLHGRWESYDIDGNLAVIGEFIKGKKTGKWFFWGNKNFTEVNFQNNKVVSHFKWKNQNVVAVK